MTYLRHLQIQNFQSHQDSQLEFHPGINIITGESDEGKSAIIRAIRWAVLNKPRGDSFKNWDASPGDPCSVTLSFACGESCTRERSSTKNSYHFKNGAEFDAIRSEIPAEVISFLNLDEVNIQNQNDQYFLLQGTPGDVAKKLNKVVRLEIIDQLLKLVDGKIRISTKDIKAHEVETTTLADEISLFDELPDFETDLSKVDSGITQLEGLLARHSSIIAIITILQPLMVRSMELSKFNNAFEHDIAKHSLAVQDFQRKRVRQQKIEKLVGVLTHTKLRQKALAKKLQAEKSVQIALRLTERQSEAQKRFAAVTGILESLHRCKRAQNRLDTLIQKKLGILQKIIETNNNCPLCGGTLTLQKLETHLI